MGATGWAIWSREPETPAHGCHPGVTRPDVDVGPPAASPDTRTRVRGGDEGGKIQLEGLYRFQSSVEVFSRQSRWFRNGLNEKLARKPLVGRCVASSAHATSIVFL